MRQVITIALLGVALLAQVEGAPAAEPDTHIITISEHIFEPAELIVPAGKKLRLIVKNMDPTPEEFESYELNREKLIPAGGEVVIFIGPLKPGNYSFFGEFHAETAQGRLVAQ